MKKAAVKLWPLENNIWSSHLDEVVKEKNNFAIE